MVLAGKRKKEEYTKPRTEGREVSYGKIGLTTVAVTQDLHSGMPLVLRIELIRLWNSILPEPGQPSAQLSKLIRLTACKKAMHATNRWYRTVCIPWLVASYDTHKGKRWLNSNPPNHRGKKSAEDLHNLLAYNPFTAPWGGSQAPVLFVTLAHGDIKMY